MSLAGRGYCQGPCRGPRPCVLAASRSGVLTFDTASNVVCSGSFERTLELVDGRLSQGRDSLPGCNVFRGDSGSARARSCA